MIAATHGKRAVDNLSQFKPHIKSHEMDAEVQKFEETILFFADAHRLHGPGSAVQSPVIAPSSLSPLSSGDATPELVASPGASLPSSRASSFAALGSRRPSFATRLNGMLSMTAVAETSIYDARRADGMIVEEGDEDVLMFDADPKKEQQHCLEAWQIEATAVDRAVRILPGVRRMIDSIPTGKYAVATSGAKTYGTPARCLIWIRGLTDCVP